MRIRHVALIALLLVAPASVRAQSPSLSSPANMKVGDFGAFFLQNIIRVRSDLSDPTVVTYEPEPNVIDVEIFGTASTADRAKEMVSRYWTFIQATHIPYLDRRFGVKLDERNYRIVYYERTQSGPKVILTFVGGQYVMGQ